MRKRPPAAQARRQLGEALVGAAEVARFLGVAKATVYRLAGAPRGIPVIVVGARARRFRPEDVRAYVERRTRQPAPPRGRAARLLGAHRA